MERNWQRKNTLSQCNNHVNIYLFKANNRNTRKRCGIYSRLTIKHQKDVNFIPSASVFIVDFEQVNARFL